MSINNITTDKDGNILAYKIKIKNYIFNHKVNNKKSCPMEQPVFHQYKNY